MKKGLYGASELTSKTLEVVTPLLAWYWFGWKLALLFVLQGCISASQAIYCWYKLHEDERKEEK